MSKGGERRRRKIARYSKRLSSFDKSQKPEMAAFMRKNMTPGERTLWTFLRRVNFASRAEKARIVWRRQVILHGFIADFYCHKFKTVIEVDGGHHRAPEKVAYDNRRDTILAKYGIRTHRIPWPFKHSHAHELRALIESWVGPMPYAKLMKSKRAIAMRKAIALIEDGFGCTSAS